MGDEVELRAVKYRKGKKGDYSRRIDDTYADEPFKFLWSFSGEKAVDRNAHSVNTGRMELMDEQAHGKKVLGKVLVMKDTGLPGFGSIYQDTGSNFILHSDNITRVLKIPYFPKSTQTKIVSPGSWYIDSIYWVFYIFNLMNLIFAAVSLIYFVKDTYDLYLYFNTNLNPIKSYLPLFLFMILAIAFIFSIGHSMTGTHSLVLIYLYIFLSMVGNYMLGIFQYFYEFRDQMHIDFKLNLRTEFVSGRNVDLFDRLQTLLQCCGVDNPCDWELIGAFGMLPKSCCQTEFQEEYSGIYDCPYDKAHHRPCSNASVELFDDILLRHSYMLWGKIFFQWLAILMATVYAIAVYNGGIDQKNNVNYESAVPVEYFNIISKGEVEFCLPLNYYDDKKSEDYKYMILMNDIRRAVNDRQFKYFNERRYMMFDVV